MTPEDEEAIRKMPAKHKALLRELTNAYVNGFKLSQVEGVDQEKLRQKTNEIMLGICHAHFAKWEREEIEKNLAAKLVETLWSEMSNIVTEHILHGQDPIEKLDEGLERASRFI